MATISQPPCLSQSANSRSSLVVAPKSRTSCFLPQRKQATISFLCTSIPHICRKLYPYWHLQGKFTARYSVFYHFTIRPFAKEMAGQVVVQMRVSEISLENGLQAQNKHDLCRTISIQNNIDKLNTFQLTQFHLWWCQVCGHGSLERIAGGKNGNKM